MKTLPLYSDVIVLLDLPQHGLFVGDAAQLPPVGESEPIVAN